MSAVESWFASAAVAQPVAQPRPKRAAAPAKRKTQSRRSFRVRGSILWMALFALGLVGVVAVNVAVLRAHVSVNDLDTKIQQLQQGNAQLASQYSSMTAAPRVEAAARRDGLIPAPALDSTLLDLDSGK
ncbi:MAG: hypothetical protein QOG85_2636 [Gaiellaceae bacterium]|jgi:cell division protein FtsL|nr:hypothetical protein [Gaiellaceae bacterium]